MTNGALIHRNYEGKAVQTVGEGMPARWALKP